MTSYDYTWHIHVLTFVETYYPFILHTPNKSHFNIELIIFIHFYRRWIHHFPHLPPSPLRSTKTCSAEMAAMGAVRLTSTSASHATKLDTFEKTARKKPCFCGIAAKKGLMEDVIEHYAVCSMLLSDFHFAGTPMRHHAPWTTINCHLLELSGNTLVLLHKRGQTVLCKEQSKWLPTLSWRHLQRKGACHRKCMLGQCYRCKIQRHAHPEQWHGYLSQQFLYIKYLANLEHPCLQLPPIILRYLKDVAYSPVAKNGSNWCILFENWQQSTEVLKCIALSQSAAPWNYASLPLCRILVPTAPHWALAKATKKAHWLLNQIGILIILIHNGYLNMGSFWNATLIWGYGPRLKHVCEDPFHLGQYLFSWRPIKVNSLQHPASLTISAVRTTKHFMDMDHYSQLLKKSTRAAKKHQHSTST